MKTELARTALDLKWGRAQTLKNEAIYALVRLAVASCSLASPRLLRTLGRSLGRLAHGICRHARKTALANISRAMPDLSEVERRRLVSRVFSRLGEHLGDTVAMLRPGAKLDVLPFEATERAVLDRARAEGHGVVFASAHLGPWERVAATLVEHGVPLTTIAREPYDPRLTAIYDALRAPRGVRAIYRGSPGAATRIVRVLRQGGVLGMPMDLKSRVPSIDAPFLGQSAATPVGPARIALRMGAAVVVGTCAPNDAVTMTRIPTADLSADAKSEHILTARINEALSARILAMPDAWVWMHERF